MSSPTPQVVCEISTIKDVEDTCVANYIECGDVVTGKTVDFPDWTGHRSGSGSAVFLITVWAPQTISVSTCSDVTDFDTHLRLFDGRPNNNTQIAESESGAGCYLIEDLLVQGTYFLTVEGRGQQEGVFELQVTSRATGPLHPGTWSQSSVHTSQVIMPHHVY